MEPDVDKMVRSRTTTYRVEAWKLLLDAFSYVAKIKAIADLSLSQASQLLSRVANAA